MSFADDIFDPVPDNDTGEDFDYLAERLAQGATPSKNFAWSGYFDVIVLAADSYQPDNLDDVKLVHAGINDYEGIPAKEFRIAVNAAVIAARAYKAGKRVLITCRAGLNRSGLVSALTLRLLGLSPEEAIIRVQTYRPGALFNNSFRAFITSYKFSDGEIAASNYEFSKAGIIVGALGIGAAVSGFLLWRLK